MSKKKINVNLNHEDLKGRYSNYVAANLNQEELVLDFSFLSPPSGELVSRIIINPGHAKRLSNMLEELVEKYEGRSGKKVEAAKQDQKIGFTPPNQEE